MIIFLLFLTLAQDGMWRDPSTGKQWAGSDNGAAVTWVQAGQYCRALTLGGFHDWQLPLIDDLQGLSGPSANTSGYHIAAPIKLTGWEWSSTFGAEKGEAWAFDFGDAGRASVVMGDSGLNRALCVRTGSGGSK